MNIFSDRERAFEQAFVNNEEARFRALALRNRLLGEWAAQRLGLKGAGYDAYVQDIASSTTASAQDEPLLERIRGDFEAHGIVDAEALVRGKMAEFLSQAMRSLQVRDG